MSGTAAFYFDALALTNTLKEYNLALALFTNNHTPVSGDSFSDYTLCTATGYADQNLFGAGWTIANETSDSAATYATQTFTFTSGTTVYGYLIYNPSGGNQLWGAELFSDGPYTFSSGGGSVVIDPKVTCG